MAGTPATTVFASTSLITTAPIPTSASSPIRTFWITVVAFILGCMVLVVGIPLSVVLIGIPMMIVGGMVMGVAGVYLFVRAVVGVIYLARDEAYPRPYALLL